MSKERTHPTDTALIMAMDRELLAAHGKAVRQHLLACDDCRSRLNALETATADSAVLCRTRTLDDGPRIDLLRGRLQQRMLEVRGEWDRSLLFRLQRMVGSVPVVAWVGVAMILIATAGWFVRPADVGAPTSSSRTESLPISHLTPGATANVTAADLCSGATASRTLVPAAVREQVLRQYRMEHVPESEYELDYLITPELGGVGEARNLWPERYDSGPWNARVKDDLEQLLSGMVCAGSIDLAVAQQDIAANWIDAYKRHFRTDRPIPQRARLGDDDGDVQFESLTRPDAGWLPSSHRMFSLAGRARVYSALPAPTAWKVARLLSSRFRNFTASRGMNS